MTDEPNFTLAEFSYDGSFKSEKTVQLDSVDGQLREYFQTKFVRLSGDLELPFEDKLPGNCDFVDYRIGSDLKGAYVLYYFHDEVIFASLMLSGNDEVQENELLQVFKFLLLDTEDAEEPTEESIESVLSSAEFDFQKISSRPVTIEVRFSDSEDDAKACQQIADANKAMSVAFFDRCQST